MKIHFLARTTIASVALLLAPLTGAVLPPNEFVLWNCPMFISPVRLLGGPRELQSLATGGKCRSK